MSDWIEELERLAGLRDKGLLTEEQFDAERSRIVPSASQPPEEEKPKSRTLTLDEANNAWDRLLDEVFPESIRGILRRSEVVEFKNNKFLVELQFERVSEFQERKLIQWKSHLSTALRESLRVIGDSEIQFVTKGSKELISN